MPKTRILISLAVVALMGIVLSQAYWINQSYQINKQQFVKEVNNTLKSYNLTNITNSIHSLLRVDGSDSTNLKDVEGLKFLNKLFESMDDSTKQDVNVSFSISDSTLQSDSAMAQLMKVLGPGLVPDSMKTKYTTNNRFKIEELKEKIEKELLKNNISVPFDLALVHKKNNRILETTCADTSVFKEISLKSEVVELAFMADNIQLGFKKETSFILNKMWSLLILSVCLILLSAFALFILLRTIFNQKKLDALKNDFINNMTHELKTPISTVSVAIEAIQKFDVIEDKKKTDEYLTIANNELARLTLMVDKILKTAAFERNEMQFNFEKTNLVELSQEVINNCSLQFTKHKVNFNFSYSNTTIFINADKVHFASVIYNLLDNAIKYAGVNPVIECKIYCRDKQVVLEVKDNGMGIAGEYQEKVFGKFFRVPTGNVHDVKGYGLGLSYVKSVVLAHKGMISLSSEKGKGSTFSIEVPAYD